MYVVKIYNLTYITYKLVKIQKISVREWKLEKPNGSFHCTNIASYMVYRVFLYLGCHCLDSYTSTTNELQIILFML